jgi:acetylornithine/succinyldiaminopimelate/putrescine aminotransferase
MSNTKTIHQHYLLNTYSFRGKTFVRGEGMYLIDDQDTQYLDCMTNYGVSIFGYNHPYITNALQDQCANITTLHCSFANDYRAEAAKRLVKRAGGTITNVYFSNSGSEAVEAALKFAMLTTGKRHIVSCINGFHGKTLGALSVTHAPKYRSAFEPLITDVDFAPYGSIKQLEKHISPETAAVILEPIQGESGVVVPDEQYLQQASDLCQQNNVLLIADEIQTGVGRTGSFLATHQSGINPDIVCLGKGLGGGMPVGATLVTKKVASHIPKNSHTSTFGGNPLACRGICATLDMLTIEQLKHVTAMGTYFLESLNKIDSPIIRQVRGRGLMIGVEVSKSQTNILQQLQQRCILACPAGEHVIRFLPPYTITKQDINTICADFYSCVQNVH